jgi:hypothetical protein
MRLYEMQELYWRLACQAPANVMKVRYSQKRGGRKMPKTGKFAFCLANHRLKPLMKPCEAERSDKGAFAAFAIVTATLPPPKRIAFFSSIRYDARKRHHHRCFSI